MGILESWVWMTGAREGEKDRRRYCTISDLIGERYNYYETDVWLEED
jgi:hypothetical protein